MKCKPILVVLLCIVVCLEIISAILAYETLGEVFRTFYWAAIALNVIFVVLALRHPNAAVIAILGLALLIIPYQFWLATRLWQLQNEAAAIVAFVYQEKLATDVYPASLADYSFQNASLSPHFHYQTGSPQCAFSVEYFVGTPTTSHSYCSSEGWSYYPD